MASYEGLVSKLNTTRRRTECLLEAANKAKEAGATERELKAIHAKFKNLEAWQEDHEKTADRILFSTEKPAEFNEEQFQDQMMKFDDVVAELNVMYAELFTVEDVVSSTNDLRRPDAAPVKLPKLNVPTFSGVIAEWTSYFSLFNSLIANNRSLTDIERLQYLRGSVRGEALDLIKNLELTDENYAVSLRLLQDRYENVRKIATSHADKILSLPTLQTASAKGIRNLITTYREHISALKVLEAVPVNAEENNLFLFLILVRKLDTVTRCNFERSLQSSKEVPTPEQLIVFLEKECAALEASSETLKNTTVRPKDSLRQITMLSSGSASNPCVGCKESTDHRLFKCPAYLKMTTVERKALVQEHRLCFNCLLDHRAVDCRSKTRCFRCRGKHHSTIHDGQGLYRASGPKGSGGENKSFSMNCGLQKPKYPEEGEETHNSHSSVQSHGVLLSTVVIGIQNSSGEYEHVRALLDTGSQANYITSYCAQRLGLHVYGKNVNIMGLSQNRVNSRGGTSLNICHRNGGPQVISTEAIVIDKITADLPTVALPDDIHRQVRDLSLADPEFHVPGPIDCLLGADIFARCVKDGKLELGVGKPAILNTKFGWVLMGSLDMSSRQSTDPLTFLVSNLSVEDRVDVYLKRFWELEEPTSREAAVTDTQCEEHYIATHGRDSAGRYMVRLPFKDTHLKLGASFSQAESRFLNLEKRLVRTPELYRAYGEFMDDYLASGHMQKCSSIVDEAIPHY